MAIDPRIALAGRAPVDVGRAFGSALLNVQRGQQISQQAQQAPFQNRLLEAQAGQAEAGVTESQQLNRVRSIALFGSEIANDVKAGNLASIRAKTVQRIAQDLPNQGVPSNDSQELLELIDNPDISEQDKLTQIDQISQQATALGQQFGVLEAPSQPTAIQQNLIASGLTPGTPEFQQELLASIRKPSGTTVTIGTGLGEEQKALAKLRARELGTIQEEANAAIDTIQSLDVLENIDVNTGALEPAKQGVAAFGRAFGLDTSALANVAAGEAFNAEAKKLVLSIKATQKGPQTDKDEETIRETIANLGNSQQGNQFIIDSSRAFSGRKIEKADFFNTFLEDKETLKGANKAWSDFKRKTPMVSSNLRTPQGLPVFFYKFEQDVRNANPQASKQEILEAWRIADKGAR